MKNLAFIFSFVLCLAFSNKGFSQQFNRPVPSDLFQYEYADQGFNGEGYFFATPFKLNVVPGDLNYVNPYATIYDSDGYLAWYTHPDVGNFGDFKYYPNTDLFSYSIWIDGGISFIILDGNLNQIDTLNTVIADEDAHDLQQAENGNWLLSTRTSNIVDLSAFVFDGTQGSVTTNIRGYGVQEFDAAGNLVFEWNSNDHISPAETYDEYGYNANDFDYCHGNAIDEDSDGNLLFSMRHTNAIYKVDRITGEIIWILGGRSSSFTFPNDAGFSAQHDIRKLPNGNYSLFDNSNMGSMPRKSRGVEYQLDTVNWTATKIDEVIHPLESYHRAMGNFSKTPDNLKVMGYGFSRRPAPTATIFDDANNILSEFIFEDSVMSYRFHYSNLPNFIQPDISCVESSGGYELTAPPAASYEWSTGETTQTITLTNIGTYQVWMPYGDGFIGSIPFVVNDLQNPCGNIGIEDLKLADDNGNYILYDLLGRKVKHPVLNQIYLQVWESGRTNKIMITK